MTFLIATVIFFYTYSIQVVAKSSVDQEILSLEQNNSPKLWYPTQFTQNIVPKGIHSHNDYWRDVPLLSALSYGVASVEADVWLWNKELLIGHEPAALTKDRTFDSLYVQPLLQIIKGQNPDTPYPRAFGSGLNGVFDTSSGTTLNLLVDMKTDGHATLPYVVQALAPLREAGYLTTYTSNGTFVQSVITVIGTGNTPLDGIQALSPRDVFYDAPLTELTNASDIYNSTVSPLASTAWVSVIGWNGLGNISEGQLGNLTKLINDSHNLGIQARFWETPGWPIHARNAVWSVLLNSGVDWLNADDIKAASEF